MSILFVSTDKISFKNMSNIRWEDIGDPIINIKLEDRGVELSKPLYESFIYSILNRPYDAYSVVKTTIQAAINSITDAAYNKRYMLFIPNGIYEEQIEAIDYVDLIGESKSGVLIKSTGAQGDKSTLDIGGENVLIANMTIERTYNSGDAGQDRPPLLCYGSTAGTHTPNGNCNTIVFNVDVNSYGDLAQSAFSSKLLNYQRVYLINSNFYTERLSGIIFHNWHIFDAIPPLAPAECYIINCTAKTESNGIDQNGLQFINFGSRQPDRMGVFGGKFRAGKGGIDFRVWNNNNANRDGQNEAWISLDNYVDIRNISLFNSEKFLKLNVPFSIPLPESVRHSEYNYFHNP